MNYDYDRTRYASVEVEEALKRWAGPLPHEWLIHGWTDERTAILYKYMTPLKVYVATPKALISGAKVKCEIQVEGSRHKMPAEHIAIGSRGEFFGALKRAEKYLEEFYESERLAERKEKSEHIRRNELPTLKRYIASLKGYLESTNDSLALAKRIKADVAGGGSNTPALLVDLSESLRSIASMSFSYNSAAPQFANDRKDYEVDRWLSARDDAARFVYSLKQQGGAPDPKQVKELDHLLDALMKRAKGVADAAIEAEGWLKSLEKMVSAR